MSFKNRTYNIKKNSIIHGNKKDIKQQHKIDIEKEFPQKTIHSFQHSLMTVKEKVDKGWEKGNRTVNSILKYAVLKIDVRQERSRKILKKIRQKHRPTAITAYGQ